MIYLVLSSLCLALLYGVYRLALSRTTLHRFNRIILLSIIGLSAVLPTIRISGIDTIDAIGDSPLLHVPEYDEIDFLSEDAIGDSPLLHDEMETLSKDAIGDSPLLHSRVATGVKVVETVTQMDWASIITYLYLMGVAFFIIRLLIGIIRAETLCRLGARRLSDGSRLVVCDGEFQPTSWRNTIVMSRKDYESDSSRMIIEHEQAHIRCRHSIDVLLAQIVCALQWFNSAAWALKHSLQEVHEFEADATVLADGFNERQYQICLVQAALGSRIGYITSNFADCSTKKRITMMRTNQSSPFVCLRALLMMPVVLVTVLLASACKPKASQDSSVIAPSEPAVESVAEPATQIATRPVTRTEPFDTAAFLQKYHRPISINTLNRFVFVERDGAIWITPDGDRTFFNVTLSNFEQEYERIMKECEVQVKDPEKVFVLYDNPDHLDKCVRLTEILSKNHTQDNIHVMENFFKRIPPVPSRPRWGYNIDYDREKCIEIKIITTDNILLTAWNGEGSDKKKEIHVRNVQELKAELDKLYPGQGAKVKYGLYADAYSSSRLSMQITQLMRTLNYKSAEYNQGPANMTHRDSIDYIILGKDGSDGGRKRHVKNMKWYNENKDKDEFFRMGFIGGQLCVCKGNDASKLAPIAFDDLVPYFKANCPDGNERSAIVLLELPMDDESVSVEFLDKLLTKMEGWITTFTKRLYLSPVHIE